ncbi:MAG: MogA/MoaB family molybdenum cofactor biosynthesis protein [Acidimicrobiia bacterium]|nr:MogA/MoaB family molybdenum cofactor biosynthesis protein [Acidimicrobiia bacterium]MDH5503041.1 MogA/MoaB family molybdenum cofactor biosynthesis protein [Acidimicrobiia bacterium]
MDTYRAVVITVSDRISRGVGEDRSGPAAVKQLNELGFVCTSALIADGIVEVETAIRQALASDPALIVTTGGTGMSPRDLTPEGTSRVIERPVPGFSEAMRSATFGTNPHGMLSRGVCGIAGRTLIVNLPGSVSGVEESMQVVAPALPHAVELLRSGESKH